MAYPADIYPVQFDVEYPESRNRLTALVRLILAIPAFIIIALVTYGLGALSFATALVILFRGKYPRQWFEWQLEANRFKWRVNAYMGLLRDEYPSTDDEQAVSLDIDYPDPSQLSRFMPIIKWLLAIPHYIILWFLNIIAFIVTVIGWFAILIIGRYPMGLFGFSVGYSRWTVRVSAYAGILATDRYPPFRFDP